MNQNREALVEIGLNVVAPTVVLLFLSGEERLGPALGLVLALAFPFVHAAASVVRRGSISPLTVVAVVSVVLTGGIGLLKLDVRWFALKEAVVPLLMGVATVISVKTPWPVLHTVLWRVLDSERVEAALAEKGTAQRFEARVTRTTLIFGAIFVASAVLTFGLARYMVTSPSGSEAFNTELGRFTALSFPVVAVPITVAMGVALRSLLLGLEQDTGVDIDDLLVVGATSEGSGPEA